MFLEPIVPWYSLKKNHSWKAISHFVSAYCPPKSGMIFHLVCNNTALNDLKFKSWKPLQLRYRWPVYFNDLPFFHNTEDYAIAMYQNTGWRVFCILMSISKRYLNLQHSRKTLMAPRPSDQKPPEEPVPGYAAFSPLLQGRRHVPCPGTTGHHGGDPSIGCPGNYILLCMYV